jgi:polyisoprenoid-binding protein YceI
MRFILYLFLSLGLAGAADADHWRSANEARLSFITTFEGESIAGEFRQFDVALEFDPAVPDAGTLEVTVDLTAADMGDPDINEVLMDPAWLDVAQFSEAVFVSEAIRMLGPDEFQATGILDLKGTRKTVVVPFTWSSSGDAARMCGRFDITRTDFGVGSGEWATDEAIGLEVNLSFDVRLERRD